MGRGPSRPSNFVDSEAADAAAPGQYDYGKKFMDDVKPRVDHCDDVDPAVD